jgi:hypothetical protein
MKVFKFHAKQGQENQVCRILTENFGKPKVQKTEQGFMITLVLPEGLSKRTVDRTLYANKVPGSVSRRNKYLVVRHMWQIWNHHGVDCYCTETGKFVKWVWIHDGCTCCGSYPEAQSKRTFKR